MKRIALFIIICLCFTCISAQEKSDIGKIPLSIIVPDNIEGLDASGLIKLQIKVAQIVTTSGMASVGYTPSFGIFAEFSINDNSVAEGGMQTLTIVSAEITLFIKQLDNNTLISSVNKHLKGSGTSKNTAISNAISNITPDDVEYKNFLKTSKEKIITYYDNRCEDLMTLAQNMVIKQDYEQALSLLMSIPIEAKSCYKNAQIKSNEVFKVYQNKTCQSMILGAKAKIASQQYSDALELLSQVDPLSTCSGEAKALIESTETKVSVQQKKEWDLALKIYEDNIALEKYRTDAIKEMVIRANSKETKHSKHKEE